MKIRPSMTTLSHGIGTYPNSNVLYPITIFCLLLLYVLLQIAWPLLTQSLLWVIIIHLSRFLLIVLSKLKDFSTVDAKCNITQNGTIKIDFT